MLFPMMQSGGDPMIVHPIRRMRDEHADHTETVRRLVELGHGFDWPAHACRSWQALYAGTRKFTDDLLEHIALENDRLFPLFDPSASG